MHTLKASIDSHESIRFDSKNRFTTHLQPKVQSTDCRLRRRGTLWMEYPGVQGWIKDKLLGDAEVSNLILNDFGCHDGSEFHEKFLGNIEGRFEIFEMSENIHYDEDTYMPSNGRFSAVLDLGQGDAVRIEAWGQNGKTMILRDLKCFDSASYDEVVKATAKERFAIFLGIALALAKNGNAALSAEEMLETLEHVVASESELLAIKQTRQIEASLSESAARPASAIRRSL